MSKLVNASYDCQEAYLDCIESYARLMRSQLKATRRMGVPCSICQNMPGTGVKTEERKIESSPISSIATCSKCLKENTVCFPKYGTLRNGFLCPECIFLGDHTSPANTTALDSHGFEIVDVIDTEDETDTEQEVVLETPPPVKKRLRFTP